MEICDAHRNGKLDPFPVSVTDIQVLTQSFEPNWECQEAVENPLFLVETRPTSDPIDRTKFLVFCILNQKILLPPDTATLPGRLPIKKIRAYLALHGYYRKCIDSCTSGNYNCLDLWNQLQLYQAPGLDKRGIAELVTQLLEQNPHSDHMANLVDKLLRLRAIDAETALDIHNRVAAKLYGLNRNLSEFRSQGNSFRMMIHALQYHLKSFPERSMLWLQLVRLKIIVEPERIEPGELKKCFQSNEDFSNLSVLMWVIWLYDAEPLWQTIETTLQMDYQPSPFGSHLQWIGLFLLGFRAAANEKYERAVEKYPNFFRESGSHPINPHFLLEIVALNMNQPEVATAARGKYKDTLPHLLEFEHPRQKAMQNAESFPAINLTELL